jgi:hypothetical protein
VYIVLREYKSESEDIKRKGSRANICTVKDNLFGIFSLFPPFFSYRYPNDEKVLLFVFVFF